MQHNINMGETQTVSLLTKLLRFNIGRSVGVQPATQFMWLPGFRTQPQLSL